MAVAMAAGLIIDSFAGGGGASTGIEWALGRSPDFAINHDDDALLMHAANHPRTVHLKENIWKVDPVAVTKGRPVFCLWASPDCRHHSKAKGGAPVSRSVRGLADVILVWAETVSPQIIMLENVEEFAQWGPLGEDGKPCPYHKGAEFARWVRHLERLGYEVEWRELRACDYGAPTIRKRLFLVARRDSKPIVWPAATHAKASDPRVAAGVLKPYRTAAEIIDWSIRAPSIFMTRAEAKGEGLNIVRPLADKSLARIAKGFDRHVMQRARTEKGAFVVGMSTGASAPFISHAQQGGRNRSADEPHHTICANAKDQNQVVMGYLVSRYGERPGQEPRAIAIDRPYPTVVKGGNGGDLAAVYIAQQNTDMVGHDPEKPLSTIVQKGCTQTPVMGYIASLQNNTARGEMGEPLGAVLAAGNHHALIAPFITSYYSEGSQDAAADAPIPTVPTKARFSPVHACIAAPPLTPAMLERAKMVARFLHAHGVWHDPDVLVEIAPGLIVWDIGMRMLTPRELARAQGFPDSYDITAGGRLTETAQRHKIGNSVSPPAAEAVARANCVVALTMPDVRRRQRAKVPTWPGLPDSPPATLFTTQEAA